MLHDVTYNLNMIMSLFAHRKYLYKKKPRWCQQFALKVFLTDHNYHSFSFKVSCLISTFHGVKADHFLVLTLGLTFYLRSYLMQVGVSNLHVTTRPSVDLSVRQSVV